MIDISKLTEADIGRRVIYREGSINTEVGFLTSWNSTFVFARFRGPAGEACIPCDVSFVFESANDKTETKHD